MDVEITVVDDRTLAGWVGAATRIDEVYMTDVDSMVESVLRKLKVYVYSRYCTPGQAEILSYNRMSRLNIIDHGNATCIKIGDDIVSMKNVHSWGRTMAQLRGNFTDDGFVHLLHCKVGQDRPLMQQLARCFGVSVYAGTGYESTVYRFNTGSYVRADPDGTYASDVGRP